MGGTIQPQGLASAGHTLLQRASGGAWSFSGNLIEAYAGDYPDKARGASTFDAWVTSRPTGPTTASSKPAERRRRAPHAVRDDQRRGVGGGFRQRGAGGGKATVTIDPVFAQTVNLAVEYHVYLTPLCQEAVLAVWSRPRARPACRARGTLDGEPSSAALTTGSWPSSSATKTSGWSKWRPAAGEVEKEKEPFDAGILDFVLRCAQDGNFGFWMAICLCCCWPRGRGPGRL